MTVAKKQQEQSGFRLGPSTRCYRCQRLAYTEQFDGLLTPRGYLCIPCQRIIGEPTE